MILVVAVILASHLGTIFVLDSDEILDSKHVIQSEFVTTQVGRRHSGGMLR